MITETRIEISSLVFFKIDVGMLLGPVPVLHLRVWIKSNIFYGVVGVMKKNSASIYLRISKEVFGGMCFWNSLIINVKQSLKCSAISLVELQLSHL